MKTSHMGISTASSKGVSRHHRGLTEAQRQWRGEALVGGKEGSRRGWSVSGPGGCRWASRGRASPVKGGYLAFSGGSSVGCGGNLGKLSVINQVLAA